MNFSFPKIALKRVAYGEPLATFRWGLTTFTTPVTYWTKLFVKPDVKKITHAAIHVRHLDHAIDWYKKLWISNFT